jgi:hypothetical protein
VSVVCGIEVREETIEGRARLEAKRNEVGASKTRKGN